MAQLKTSSISNGFTPQEAAELRRCLLALWRLPNARMEYGEARKLYDFLATACANEVPRDAFGINRVVLALQTIELAVSEIGLRGAVLKAYLLCAVGADERHEGLCKLMGADVVNAMAALRRVEAL